MGASCAATAIAGRWSDFSRGCITSVGSSPDGNTTLKTSSASFTSDAFSCCSNIYETASSTGYINLGTALIASCFERIVAGPGQPVQLLQEQGTPRRSH